jgi:cysteine desulfurase
VPGIVALGLAVELAAAARAEAAPRMARLRDQLWQSIAAALPTARRHGDPAHAAPHVLSVGFPHVPAEPLLHALEGEGVYVSAGSACHARERKPSPTLRALGVPAHMGTIRLSLSRLTSDDEIARAAQAVVACVRALT